MFERYTENARRALFFARYEASELGDLEIKAEHLRLGLVDRIGTLTAGKPEVGPLLDEIRERVAALQRRISQP